MCELGRATSRSARTRSRRRTQAGLRWPIACSDSVSQVWRGQQQGPHTPGAPYWLPGRRMRSNTPASMQTAHRGRAGGRGRAARLFSSASGRSEPRHLASSVAAVGRRALWRHAVRAWWLAIHALQAPSSTQPTLLGAAPPVPEAGARRGVHRMCQAADREPRAVSRGSSWPTARAKTKKAHMAAP